MVDSNFQLLKYIDWSGGTACRQAEIKKEGGVELRGEEGFPTTSRYLPTFTKYYRTEALPTRSANLTFVQLRLISLRVRHELLNVFPMLLFTASIEPSGHTGRISSSNAQTLLNLKTIELPDTTLAAYL